MVILGRSHQFSTSSAVQSELSPLVSPLVPHSVRGIDGAIPIMTTQAGIGKRRVLAEVQSPMSGWATSAADTILVLAPPLTSDVFTGT